jgi:hypothetical protein
MTLTDLELLYKKDTGLDNLETIDEQEICECERVVHFQRNNIPTEEYVEWLEEWLIECLTALEKIRELNKQIIE